MAFSFEVGSHGSVSGEVTRACNPVTRGTLVLAHGAGAPRTHPFMTSMATRLAAKGVDVVTFNFPYAEAGRRMPDRVEVLESTWRAAIATVRARIGLPTERLFIGGKSMGGRIATRIASADEGLVLAGVVLFGYPLHPIGKPTVVRDEILRVRLPMLVVQGTRDKLGTAADMQDLLADMPHAYVHAVAGGDHSLAIPKSEGSARQEELLDAAAAVVATFTATTRPGEKTRSFTKKRRFKDDADERKR